MAQHHQDIFRSDRVIEVALVNFAGERETDDGRELAAFTDTSQDGRPADWRPCGGHLGAKGKAGFVDEYYCSPLAASFFLIRRQSRVSQV